MWKRKEREDSNERWRDWWTNSLTCEMNRGWITAEEDEWWCSSSLINIHPSIFILYSSIYPSFSSLHLFLFFFSLIQMSLFPFYTSLFPFPSFLFFSLFQPSDSFFFLLTPSFFSDSFFFFLHLIPLSFTRCSKLTLLHSLLFPLFKSFFLFTLIHFIYPPLQLTRTLHSFAWLHSYITRPHMLTKDAT